MSIIYPLRNWVEFYYHLFVFVIVVPLPFPLPFILPLLFSVLWQIHFFRSRKTLLFSWSVCCCFFFVSLFCCLTQRVKLFSILCVDKACWGAFSLGSRFCLLLVLVFNFHFKFLSFCFVMFFCWVSLISVTVRSFWFHLSLTFVSMTSEKMTSLHFISFILFKWRVFTRCDVFIYLFPQVWQHMCTIFLFYPDVSSFFFIGFFCYDKGYYHGYWDTFTVISM